MARRVLKGALGEAAGLDLWLDDRGSVDGEPPGSIAFDVASHKDIRVVVLMDAVAFWARELLRGLNEIALERGWTLLPYSPRSDLGWLLREWAPAALVASTLPPSPLPDDLAGRVIVGANVDLSAEGLPWVGVDDDAVGELAAAHLVAKGLEHFATFSFEEGGWARRRLERFRARVVELGGRCHSDGWLDTGQAGRMRSEPESIPTWLRDLPKPCGVFACCDTWARVIAAYCRGGKLRVPEDIALLGADDDPVECELSAPALSSVVIPWREIGREVGTLVLHGLEHRLSPEPVLVRPLHVAERRSSDVLAVDDPLVASAVTWIHQHSDRQLTVGDVVRAVKTYRQRLEKRFRAVLGRSIMEEVRRSRIERAKRLLAMTDLALPDVASRSGFTSASLLNVAFHRETHITPGAFRRRTRTSSHR